MPLTEICNSTYSNPRERQLFKNIICLGALAGMMGIDVDAIISLIAEQYKGKERLLQPNVQALRLGLNYLYGGQRRGCFGSSLWGGNRMRLVPDYAFLVGG
jgi:Pyruvate/2-oxoacid:ferredoxin oxidoreductase gamma subunit